MLPLHKYIRIILLYICFFILWCVFSNFESEDGWIIQLLASILVLFIIYVFHQKNKSSQKTNENFEKNNLFQKKLNWLFLIYNIWMLRELFWLKEVFYYGKLYYSILGYRFSIETGYWIFGLEIVFLILILIAMSFFSKKRNYY